MDPYKLRRLRGAAELIPVAVDAGVRQIEKAHGEVTRGAYRWVGRIPGLGGPARVVGAMQASLTSVVYGAIRAVNATAHGGVRLVFDVLERRAGAPAPRRRGADPEERADGSPGRRA